MMEAGEESPAADQPPPMDWNLLSIIAVSSALSAAQATGIFPALRERALTPAESAQLLRLDERTTHAVLEVLASVGLLNRADGRYAMPTGRSLAGHYTPGLLEAMQQVFAHTTQVLRSGEPITWMDALEHRESKYPSVVGELGDSYADVAAHLAKQIDHQIGSPISGQPAQILDIGCGSGVWSLAVAELQTQVRVTGLDLAPVLDNFKSRAHSLSLSARISELAGDMYEVPLPADYFDLIIIANVLRLESENQAIRLIARATAALRPGGRLLIVDAMAKGLPATELVRAAYTLLLTLRTKIGRVYSPAQITKWLQAAGLSAVQELDCQVRLTEIGALLGTKPATRLVP